MKVIGMGEKKTPSPFIVACDKFIYIEVIRAAQEQELRKPADKQKQNGRQSKQQDKKVQTQQKQSRSRFWRLNLFLIPNLFSRKRKA